MLCGDTAAGLKTMPRLAQKSRQARQNGRHGKIFIEGLMDDKAGVEIIVYRPSWIITFF
jgi:hypothetical protein